MGPPHRSRKSVLLFPILFLLGSVTVLFGAGDFAKITSPAHRAKVSGTVEVTTRVNASGSVSYAVLVVDGARPASTNAAPWTFSLDTRELTNGPHQVAVEVYDSRGLIAAAKAITISVKNQAAAPAVVAHQQPSHSPSKTIVLARHPIAPRTVAAAPAAKPAAAITPVVTARGPAPEPSPAASLETRISSPAPAAKMGNPVVAAAAPSPTPVKPADSLPSHPTPTIVLNGQPFNAGVSPTLVDGRLHTGFRALFAASGARVEWIAATRTARCVTDSLTIAVPIGSRIATVNGRHVDLGAVASLRDGRTVVPLQFFAQVTGSHLSWEARTRIASLRTPSHTLASVPASLSPATSASSLTPAPAEARSPIHEVADRAP